MGKRIEKQEESDFCPGNFVLCKGISSHPFLKAARTAFSKGCSSLGTAHAFLKFHQRVTTGHGRTRRNVPNSLWKASCSFSLLQNHSDRRCCNQAAEVIAFVMWKTEEGLEFSSSTGSAGTQGSPEKTPPNQQTLPLLLTFVIVLGKTLGNSILKGARWSHTADFKATCSRGNLFLCLLQSTGCCPDLPCPRWPSSA